MGCTDLALRSLLLLPLLFAFVISGTNDCYYPNGELAEGTFACRGEFSGTSTGVCCKSGDVCLNNTLCATEVEASGNLVYYRGACLDPTWSSPACPSFCVRSEYEGQIPPVYPCGEEDKQARWCCKQPPAKIGTCKDNHCLRFWDDSSLLPEDTSAFEVSNMNAASLKPSLTSGSAENSTGSIAPLQQALASPAAADEATTYTTFVTTTFTKTEGDRATLTYELGYLVSERVSTTTEISGGSEVEEVTTITETAAIPITFRTVPLATQTPSDSTTNGVKTSTSPDTARKTETVTATSRDSTTTTLPSTSTTETARRTATPTISAPDSAATTSSSSTGAPSPSGPAQDSDGNPSDVTAIPIGIGIGLALTIFVAGGVLGFFYIRKRRRQARARAETPPPFEFSVMDNRAPSRLGPFHTSNLSALHGRYPV
ncbi:hypothetical protein VTK56DRAFT_1526 [Thermocarpiscus australiensis]